MSKDKIEPFSRTLQHLKPTVARFDLQNILKYSPNSRLHVSGIQKVRFYSI
jgi:hypothetical protein